MLYFLYCFVILYSGLLFLLSLPCMEYTTTGIDFTSSSLPRCFHYSAVFETPPYISFRSLFCFYVALRHISYHKLGSWKCFLLLYGIYCYCDRIRKNINRSRFSMYRSNFEHLDIDAVFQETVYHISLYI